MRPKSSKSKKPVEARAAAHANLRLATDDLIASYCAKSRASIGGQMPIRPPGPRRFPRALQLFRGAPKCRDQGIYVGRNTPLSGNYRRYDGPISSPCRAEQPGTAAAQLQSLGRAGPLPVRASLRHEWLRARAHRNALPWRLRRNCRPPSAIA